MTSPAHISPPPWVSGSPGEKNHRTSLSPGSETRLRTALDAIDANPIERRVALLIYRVRSLRSALKVVKLFRSENQGGQLPLFKH